MLRNLILVGLFLIWSLPALAAPYKDKVVERTLENGFKMILLEDHKAPVAVVQA